MITQSMFRALGAAWALGAGVSAFAEGNFPQVAERLDLDGSVVAYADFEGDGQAIGDRLSALYQKLAEADPNIPPMPLDFAAVFETLGFGSIRAVGLSSKELEDGLARNRAVTLLDGEPKGLVKVYGLEPIEFRAAELAPADATLALSGQLDLETLRETLVATASLLMGPMGEGLAQQALTQPIAGSELTGNQMVEALSGRFDLIMKQDYRDLEHPEMSFWLSIDQAGSLMSQLETLARNVTPEIQIEKNESGRTLDLSSLLEGAPFGLLARQEAQSDRLQLYSDEAWRQSLGQGQALADTEAFRKVAARLPEEAAFFSYSAGFDASGLAAAFQQDPESAKYAPVLEDALAFLIGDFLEPNASAYFRIEDALVSEQYASYTYKQALVAAPAIGVASLGAAAIPALKQMQANTRKEQVRNNLRTIAETAQVVMLETRDDEVTYEEILASPAGVEVESVMGETYDHIVITAETAEISVELPNGDVVSHPVAGLANE